MGKIYSAPKEIAVPSYTNFKCYDLYEKACDEYVEKIQEYARKLNPCPEAGEIVYFPVADGQAQYVVVSLKPVTLIHLDIGDAWDFQYANRLTASDIRKKIKAQKVIQELFKNKTPQ